MQGIRSAVLAGTGIWKWRLNNYLEHKNFEAIDEFFSKSIQYITIKDDKRKFRVQTASKTFKIYDPVKLFAELYNDSYEQVNSSDVLLTIKNDLGDAFEYSFNKEANYYTLDAGSLPAGNYNYTGRTNFNGKNLKASGKFSVQDVQLESSNTTADHALLVELANRYNGEVLYQPGAELLAEKIQNNKAMKPVVYSSQHTESAMHLPWILFGLVFLLCLEWFLRRLFGTY